MDGRKRVDIQVIGGAKTLKEQLNECPSGLIDSLTDPDALFFDKNSCIDGGDVDYYFSHNLIKTTPTSPENTKFYVISSKADGSCDEDGEPLLKGKGCYSTVRKITHSIEITPDHQIAVQKVQGKVARIKNRQEAELKRPEGDYYDHNEAVAEYEIAKNFPHLNMEPPVEVVKYKTGHVKFAHYDDPAFIKSYSVMNDLPGIQISSMFDPKQYGPFTIKETLELFILPVLEAYKAQVGDIKFVHRDIKPGNVLLELGKYASSLEKPSTPSIVNFIDVDMSARIGEEEILKGSPAFMPPEVTRESKESIKACQTSQARDIFALGILLISCINPDLDPFYYFETAGIYKNNKNMPIKEQMDIVTHWENLLNSLDGWYNPEELINMARSANSVMIKCDGHGLFSYLTGADIELKGVQQQILSILQSMTNVHAQKRLSIEECIEKFQIILDNLPSLAKTDKIYGEKSDSFTLFSQDNQNLSRRKSSPKKPSPKKHSPTKDKENASMPRKTSSEKEKGNNTNARRKLSYPENDIENPTTGMNKSPRRL